MLTKCQGSRLLAAHTEISAEIEVAIARLQGEKWAKIQKTMEDKGTMEKYPSLFLQKKYEELSTNPEAVAAAGEADKSDTNADTASDGEVGTATEVKNGGKEKGVGDGKGVKDVAKRGGKKDIKMEDAAAIGENNDDEEGHLSEAVAEEI